jgi:tRNA/tmRNA/rRNA uracil-C5-methylase (TrmA/RlmC/RlmD family)
MRAEFRIWHDEDEMYHIMFDQQTKQRIRVEQFPAASELINRLMSALIAAINCRILFCAASCSRLITCRRSEQKSSPRCCITASWTTNGKHRQKRCAIDLRDSGL